MPYDADFLGSVSVPLPTLLPGTAQHAWNNGAVVDHTNYSLVFNQAREPAVYPPETAHITRAGSITTPRNKCS